MRVRNIVLILSLLLSACGANKAELPTLKTLDQLKLEKMSCQTMDGYVPCQFVELDMTSRIGYDCAFTPCEQWLDFEESDFDTFDKVVLLYHGECVIDGDTKIVPCIFEDQVK